jgi:vacuolar-type H+-ATPase subunit F/Vma7
MIENDKVLIKKGKERIMKMIALVNQTDRQIGYRLAGIDSRVVNNQEELSKDLEKIDQSKDIGIIVINSIIYHWNEEEWQKRMDRQTPVIVVLEE